VQWYVVAAGRFEYVGQGDVSEADMRAVGRELREGIFVAVGQPKTAEDVLGTRAWGLRRLRWADKLRRPISPKLAWVAKGARIAVLPEMGTVWVDGERLFTPGEPVPLPWTSPEVALVVLRPSALLKAMEAILGPAGPRRATGIPGLEP
jgi:hypothetical protein